MSFTCPKCYRVSFHPDDEKHGYCGYCHSFTGVPQYEAYGGRDDGQQRPRSSSTQAEPDRPVQLPEANQKPKAE